MSLNILTAIRNFRDPPMIKQQRRLKGLIGEGRDRCCEKVCRRCTKISKIKILRSEIAIAMKRVQNMPQLGELLQKKGLSIRDIPIESLGKIYQQGVVIGRCKDEEGAIFEIAYDEKKKGESAFTIMKYSLNV